jgi:glycosyltransferase involved in cell wall biosynthesis
MMRVVVNRQSMLIGPRAGIAHYTAQLLQCLPQFAGPAEIDAYPNGWIWDIMQARDGGRVPYRALASRSPEMSVAGLAGCALSVPVLRSALRGWLEPWKLRHFQATCRRQRYDLYHEPNILPMPCDCPTVATLHDLSVIAHPEWHPADRVRQYHRHLNRMLSQCVHLLTGSDYVRQEIVDVLGIAPARVTRVYHGIREGLAPLPANQVAAGLEALGLPPEYLLHVGTLEPRKNLELLMQAFCGLPPAVRSRCPLLLVGKWGWNTATLAALLESEAKQHGVIHLGYFPEEHLPLLYNGARALVFPSLYEGFGLPPLEMLACGGAVLASTAGPLPEVLGAHGCLIDPFDLDGWREAMQRVVLDDDWRQSLRHGATAWAAPFTWQRCAKETYALYRQLLGGTQPLAA